MLLRRKRKINYFIVDTPLYGFEAGKEMAEIIKTKWQLIFEIGDYAVYRKPEFFNS